jgi:putative ABC transport system permease protein
MLIEGRWTRADDVGTLVISEELAELNNLSVGDVLIFETLPMIDVSMLEVMKRHGFNEPPPTQISGEIVGIYQNNRNVAFSVMPGIVSRSAENSIFTDLHFVEVGARTGDPFYYKAYFHVANVDEFDKVAARLLSADIDWSRYTLIERNDAIEELGSSFAQLREIGQMMLIISLVSGFLILSLAFTFFMKGRSHEIGIWLSLGNHKRKIILQMLWENTMLAAVALVICFVTIPLVVGWAETLLNNQIVAETSDYQAEGVYAGNESVIAESVQLTVNTDTFAIVAGAIFVLIITATVLAVTPVARLKPREIFARLS